ncbi:MAG: bifunctional diaminohydroxyphosphoribosylaminopyrimidine deaminase/5-amino-6-(5-phosphoribosylamino)uracil reductase RibD, partial [Dehalococcoidia bacterium]|nr:bifunctional diaminohydroxyphosphoribosylaminopyrimidine deaminase/5-amino-6-(5-phosphoribosylamino)uracil reductase RibD [Dehalococcoidia bacterium]
MAGDYFPAGTGTLSPPMRRALSLAGRALGTTSPNPVVGAVLVRGGSVVGEGYTQPPGGPHAEAVALEGAGKLSGGAKLYVTLEPCSHTPKRTPPCAQAIVAAGVTEVHIATLDTNPQVLGRGVEVLRAAGIRVQVGEGQSEARQLNEAYFKYTDTGLPFVTAKFAMSLDGKIAAASGDSQWISGPSARLFVHRLRRQVDAVMVGINTVLADDPRLTARSARGLAVKAPLRVVVDSQGHLPAAARMLRESGETVVATAGARPRTGAEVWLLPGEGGRVDLAALLARLGGRGVTSLLVEGGGVLLASLLEAGMVDKLYAVISPIIIGGGDAPTPVAGKGVARV